MRKKSNNIKCNYLFKFTIAIFILILSLLILENTTLAQNHQLQINPDERVIKNNEPFSVNVVNETGKPVKGANVYIDSTKIQVKTTDEDGNAILYAPSKAGDYVIVAEKEGFIKDTYKITVYSNPTFWESPYFPIAVAIICLISAIVYVTLKQNKDVNLRAKEISQENLIKKQGLSEKFSFKKSDKKRENETKNNYENGSNEIDLVRSKTTNDAKVEEIRISRPYKQKEVVPIGDKNDEKTDSEDKDKTVDEWYEGTDEFRYELDKLTGDIDEKELDKWFEGTNHLKDKIKDKVKKKKKDDN